MIVHTKVNEFYLIAHMGRSWFASATYGALYSSSCVSPDVYDSVRQDFMENPSWFFSHIENIKIMKRRLVAGLES